MVIRSLQYFIPQPAKSQQLPNLLFRKMLLTLLLCFVIITTESVPLEDSNFEEDEVEEEFDPTCLSAINSTETKDDSDELELIQGDKISKVRSSHLQFV